MWRLACGFEFSGETFFFPLLSALALGSAFFLLYTVPLEYGNSFLVYPQALGCSFLRCKLFLGLQTPHHRRVSLLRLLPPEAAKPKKSVIEFTRCGKYLQAENQLSQNSLELFLCFCLYLTFVLLSPCQRLNVFKRLFRNISPSIFYFFYQEN